MAAQQSAITAEDVEVDAGERDLEPHPVAEEKPEGHEDPRADLLDLQDVREGNAHELTRPEPGRLPCRRSSSGPSGAPSRPCGRTSDASGDAR